MGFGLKGVGKTSETTRAREVGTVRANELAGDVKVPERSATSPRDEFGRPASPEAKKGSAEHDAANFRAFAERQGASGVPGIDVASASPALSRLEALPWKDFVAELKSRTPEGRLAALDELDGLMGHLESLEQDLPRADPATKALGKRLDALVSRQQLVLQALESPRVLDQAVDP